MGKLADSNRKNANRYWSKSINNEGNYNYGKAKNGITREKETELKL